jgi:hypothetical protein
MANTYTIIDKATLGSSQSAITFTSIPSTYTDLLVVLSGRLDQNTVGVNLTFNGSTSSYSQRTIYSTGSGAASDTGASSSYIQIYGVNASTYTSNTFGNTSLYIPNYTSSNNKSLSVDATTENNAAGAFMALTAGLWSNSSAITSITLTASSGNLTQHSSAYLYGIKNS